MAIYTLKTELVTDDTKGEGYVSGYASVFGGVDFYDDTIEPGAYDAVLSAIKSGAAPMPKMFFNHNYYDSVPVGKWTDVSVDDRGLKIAGQLNLNIQQGRDIYEAVKFGTIDGLSVSIRMKQEDMETDGEDIRHIKNVRELKEVSLCTFPADKNARIITYKAEADAEAIKSIRDLETYLRDAGLPATEAKTIISAAKRVILNDSDQRDAAEKTRGLTAINDRLKAILTVNH